MRARPRSSKAPRGRSTAPQEADVTPGHADEAEALDWVAIIAEAVAWRPVLSPFRTSTQGQLLLTGRAVSRGQPPWSVDV